MPLTDQTKTTLHLARQAARDGRVGYLSETYGLHEHKWETEPVDQFIPTALNEAVKRHSVACFPVYRGPGART